MKSDKEQLNWAAGVNEWHRVVLKRVGGGAGCQLLISPHERSRSSVLLSKVKADDLLLSFDKHAEGQGVIRGHFAGLVL